MCSGLNALTSKNPGNCEVDNLNFYNKTMFTASQFVQCLAQIETVTCCLYPCHLLNSYRDIFGNVDMCFRTVLEV